LTSASSDGLVSVALSTYDLQRQLFRPVLSIDIAAHKTAVRGRARIRYERTIKKTTVQFRAALM
jgi:hypothetical protein